MRDTDLELYDATCRLLEAAQELRAIAGQADPATAIAPTLGCLQAGLEEMELAVGTLREAWRTRHARPVQRLRGALYDFAVALGLAARAADAARAAAARATTAPAAGPGTGRRRFRALRRRRPAGGVEPAGDAVVPSPAQS